MLLGKLSASSSGNMLPSKGLIRSSKDNIWP